MKANLYYPFLVVLISLPGSRVAGQPSPFGSVTKEELAMTTHPLDSTAQAIILFDVGNVSGKSYVTSFERHLRIKLFDKGSFDSWGTQKFLVRKGSLSKIRAATYYLENDEVRMQEVPREAIYRTKVSKMVEEVSLAFTNLREGCVLELSYTERNGGVYLPAWVFQYNIPNLWSEYSIHTPLTHVDYVLSGTLALTKYDNNPKRKSQRWLIQNIPAFKPEPLMPDPGIYRSSLRFSEGNSSWASVYASYVKRPTGGGAIHLCPDLKKRVDSLIRDVNDPKQKIRVISEYIKQEVEWSGIRDIFADPPDKILENKEGTAGDINLLLGCLLDKAGFEVSPVLLSTRANGLILEEATELAQFDYVVCQVELGGEIFLLDATEKSLPFDMLPDRCYNHSGFLISRVGFQWIRIEPTKAERTVVESDLTLSESGDLKGTVKRMLYDYAGFLARKICEETGSEVLIEALEEATGQSASNIRLSNLDEKDKPVKVEYETHLTEPATVMNEKIYFSPFVNHRGESNPFTESIRSYPVDFPLLSDLTVITKISIPDGFEIESLPKSSVVVLPDNGGKCSFNFSQLGNQLSITFRTQINKTLFMPEEYPQLKAFYSEMLARKGKNIVLQKHVR